MNWILRTNHGQILRFNSMVDAIRYAEQRDMKDCTVEGPALDEIDVFSAISEVEAAGFNIASECFLASFDGKVN
jgi:hypothetical protein